MAKAKGQGQAAPESALPLPRPATEDDLDAVAELYERSRAFMHANGNPTQWPGDYPGRADAEADLSAGHLWVIDEGTGPVAVMSVMPGPDPTYAVIEGDGWLDDEPYWVMHRMATGEQGRGLGTRCLSWLCERHANVRADTHEDNAPMRRTLERCGFVPCGTIWVEDGTPRVAYHFRR